MEINHLKEEANHGTVIFPLAVYAWKGESKGNVNLHWHEETEIIFLEKGVFEITVNMNTYTLKAPALVYVGAGSIHSLILEKGQKESAVVFDLNMLSFEYFDGIQYEIIAPLLEKRVQFPLFVTPKDAVWVDICELYHKIFKEATIAKLGSYMKIKGYLYEMLAGLYESGELRKQESTETFGEHKVEIIKKVLRYVKEEYAERIAVDDIAALVGMNAQYLCRYFKKMTGKTLTEYINEVRIEKAVELLAETDEKVITVATACGYDNISYFIKRFKKQKGVTPQEYRKKKSK